MIITQNFVVINFPKTGSTFVREVLKELLDHSNKWKIFGRRKIKEYQQLQLPNIRIRNTAWQQPDDHAIRSQIPQEHQAKEIVSVVRDPIDRWISYYSYSNWQKLPEQIREEALLDFPSWPDLTFEQFYDYTNKYKIPAMFPDLHLKVKLGMLSVQFIQFFTLGPKSILESIDEVFISSNKIKNYLKGVTFLKNESLNKELFEFLLKKGFVEKDIQFILEKGKSNESTNEVTLTDRVKEKIMHDERLLYSHFEEYKPNLVE